MRLLIATPARGAIGGVETYLRGLAPALIARGHTLALLYERKLEMGDAGIDPYAGCAAEWSAERQPAAALIEAVRAWQPELIWLNGVQDAALEQGLLALAPAIAYAHNYDGLCATGAKSRRWPRAHACARPLGMACGAINFTQHCGTINPVAFARQWRRERRRAAQWPRYRRVLVASHHMAAELQRQGLPAARVRRVGYPRFEPLPAAPVPRPGPAHAVVMMARLTRLKGAHVLLHAVARAQREMGRRLRVTIAGNGPEQPRLQALAQRLRIDAEFPGWIGSGARQQLLQAADLLAVPSLWPEPFGMTGIEAAGYGVPAVGFAVGGIPDWLRPGRSGELAPPTAAGLAAALTAALTRALADAEHWNSLRQGAWVMAAEFALEPHLQQLEAIFREAVA